MTPHDHAALATELCDTCRLFGDRGWCRATSGNFSVRVSAELCMITQSGREKSVLTPDDLMICRLDGVPCDAQHRPSAETPLHTCLYRMDPGIGAVLHTHSVAATLLSRCVHKGISVSGFEMQKAITGVNSHEEQLSLAVFDNTQDMQALAVIIEDAWQAGQLKACGFLIRGHGLYSWGRDLAAARRHTEGLEFLMECLWQDRLAASP